MVLWQQVTIGCQYQHDWSSYVEPRRWNRVGQWKIGQRTNKSRSSKIDPSLESTSILEEKMSRSISAFPSSLKWPFITTNYMRNRKKAKLWTSVRSGGESMALSTDSFFFWLNLVLKKAKHRIVETMSSTTADALGLSRAILCNGQSRRSRSTGRAHFSCRWSHQETRRTRTHLGIVSRFDRTYAIRAESDLRISAYASQFWRCVCEYRCSWTSIQSIGSLYEIRWSASTNRSTCDHLTSNCETGKDDAFLLLRGQRHYRTFI